MSADNPKFKWRTAHHVAGERYETVMASLDRENSKTPRQHLIAVLQMNSTGDKIRNMRQAEGLIRQAFTEGFIKVSFVLCFIQIFHTYIDTFISND